MLLTVCRPRNFSFPTTLELQEHLDFRHHSDKAQQHTIMICRNCIQRATALGRRSILQNAPIRRSFSATKTPRQAAAAAAAPAAPSNDATSEEPPARSTCPPGTVLNGLNYFKGKTDPVALPDAEYPEWLWSCLNVLKKAGGDEDSGLGDEYCTSKPSFTLFPVICNGQTCTNTLYAPIVAKSKKQRRIAAKRQRTLESQLLAAGDLEALAPKIPLQHQSINLPGSTEGTVEDNVAALQKREELRKAMRKERKAKIKEANYLKSM